jgi:hypothetical protein
MVKYLKQEYTWDGKREEEETCASGNELSSPIKCGEFLD